MDIDDILESGDPPPPWQQNAAWREGLIDRIRRDWHFVFCAIDSVDRQRPLKLVCGGGVIKIQYADHILWSSQTALEEANKPITNAILDGDWGKLAGLLEDLFSDIRLNEKDGG